MATEHFNYYGKCEGCGTPWPCVTAVTDVEAVMREQQQLYQLLDEFGYFAEIDGAPITYLRRLFDDQADDRVRTLRAGVCITCYEASITVTAEDRFYCDRCGSVYELPAP